MTTYGQLRLAIQKANPGIDVELIDGWIQDIYQEIILNSQSWKRLEQEIVIQSPPSYSVGTCTVVQGDATVTVQDGTWTPEMEGRLIRFGIGTTTGSLTTYGSATAGNTEYYQFHFVDAGTCELDRPFEGTTASIVASSVSNPGSGYLPGDVFYVTGGNGLANGTVLTTGLNGQVASYNITAPGNNYAVGIALTSGGSGAGFSIDITAVGGTANAPYRIDQNVFVLPANTRLIRGVRPMHDNLKSLDCWVPGELNRKAPQRLEYGTPQVYTQAYDTNSSPPRLQVELYPIPSSPDAIGNTLSFVVDIIADAAPLDPNVTSFSLLPWVHTSALKEGVQAKIERILKKDLQLAGAAAAEMVDSINKMKNVDARQRGPQRIRIAAEYLGNSKQFYRKGPWHEGWPG